MNNSSPDSTESYLRTKKTLGKVMRKLSIQQLKEIARHRSQSYIFFDCAIDALMGKLNPKDFQAFAQNLYNEQFWSLLELPGIILAFMQDQEATA